MANIFKSKYTGEQIEEILDKSNNVTDIQANNGEPTTADLSTLKIGDVNYKIPEPTPPEESTVVEANPSGEATVELNKLKVGETIYSIPQGNGGNGGDGVALGHTITAVGTVTKVYYADGTTELNPSVNTFSNVIAIDFNAISTASGGYISTPFGIKSYSANSYYTNETFTTGSVPYTINNRVYVRFFPLADGTISQHASGGGSD